MRQIFLVLWPIFRLLVYGITIANGQFANYPPYELLYDLRRLGQQTVTSQQGVPYLRNFNNPNGLNTPEVLEHEANYPVKEEKPTREKFESNENFPETPIASKRIPRKFESLKEQDNGKISKSRSHTLSEKLEGGGQITSKENFGKEARISSIVAVKDATGEYKIDEKLYDPAKAKLTIESIVENLGLNDLYNKGNLWGIVLLGQPNDSDTVQLPLSLFSQYSLSQQEGGKENDWQDIEKSLPTILQFLHATLGVEINFDRLVNTSNTAIKRLVEFNKLLKADETGKNTSLQISRNENAIKKLLKFIKIIERATFEAYSKNTGQISNEISKSKKKSETRVDERESEMDKSGFSAKVKKYVADHVLKTVNGSGDTVKIEAVLMALRKLIITPNKKLTTDEISALYSIDHVETLIKKLGYTGRLTEVLGEKKQRNKVSEEKNSKAKTSVSKNKERLELSEKSRIEKENNMKKYGGSTETHITGANKQLETDKKGKVEKHTLNKIEKPETRPITEANSDKNVKHRPTPSPSKIIDLDGKGKSETLENYQNVVAATTETNAKAHDFQHRPKNKSDNQSGFKELSPKTLNINQVNHNLVPKGDGIQTGRGGENRPSKKHEDTKLELAKYDFEIFRTIRPKVSHSKSKIYDTTSENTVTTEDLFVKTSSDKKMKYEDFTENPKSRTPNDLNDKLEVLTKPKENDTNTKNKSKSIPKPSSMILETTSSKSVSPDVSDAASLSISSKLKEKNHKLGASETDTKHDKVILNDQPKKAVAIQNSNKVDDKIKIKHGTNPKKIDNISNDMTKNIATTTSLNLIDDRTQEIDKQDNSNISKNGHGYPAKNKLPQKEEILAREKLKHHEPVMSGKSPRESFPIISRENTGDDDDENFPLNSNEKYSIKSKTKKFSKTTHSKSEEESNENWEEEIYSPVKSSLINKSDYDYSEQPWGEGYGATSKKKKKTKHKFKSESVESTENWNEDVSDEKKTNRKKSKHKLEKEAEDWKETVLSQPLPNRWVNEEARYDENESKLTKNAQTLPRFKQGNQKTSKSKKERTNEAQTPQRFKQSNQKSSHKSKEESTRESSVENWEDIPSEDEPNNPFKNFGFKIKKKENGDIEFIPILPTQKPSVNLYEHSDGSSENEKFPPKIQTTNQNKVSPSSIGAENSFSYKAKLPQIYDIGGKYNGHGGNVMDPFFYNTILGYPYQNEYAPYFNDYYTPYRPMHHLYKQPNYTSPNLTPYYIYVAPDDDPYVKKLSDAVKKGKVKPLKTHHKHSKGHYEKHRPYFQNIKYYGQYEPNYFKKFNPTHPYSNWKNPVSTHNTENVLDTDYIMGRSGYHIPNDVKYHQKKMIVNARLWPQDYIMGNSYYNPYSNYRPNRPPEQGNKFIIDAIHPRHPNIKNEFEVKEKKTNTKVPNGQEKYFDWIMGDGPNFKHIHAHGANKDTKISTKSHDNEEESLQEFEEDLEKQFKTHFYPRFSDEQNPKLGLRPSTTQHLLSLVYNNMITSDDTPDKLDPKDEAALSNIQDMFINFAEKMALKSHRTYLNLLNLWERQAEMKMEQHTPGSHQYERYNLLRKRWKMIIDRSLIAGLEKLINHVHHRPAVGKFSDWSGKPNVLTFGSYDTEKYKLGRPGKLKRPTLLFSRKTPMQLRNELHQNESSILYGSSADIIFDQNDIFRETFAKKLRSVLTERSLTHKTVQPIALAVHPTLEIENLPKLFRENDNSSITLTFRGGELPRSDQFAILSNAVNKSCQLKNKGEGSCEISLTVAINLENPKYTENERRALCGNFVNDLSKLGMSVGSPVKKVIGKTLRSFERINLDPMDCLGPKSPHRHSQELSKGVKS